MYINERSLGLLESFGDKIFHILGCGAIGSSAALQIARMGADKFCLYDMDKVEEVNVGCSQYIMADIGLPKVDALDQHLHSISTDVNIVKIYLSSKEGDILNRFRLYELEDFRNGLKQYFWDYLFSSISDTISVIQETDKGFKKIARLYTRV